jgi:hypothetical protein
VETQGVLDLELAFATGRAEALKTSHRRLGIGILLIVTGGVLVRASIPFLTIYGLYNHGPRGCGADGVSLRREERRVLLPGVITLSLGRVLEFWGLGLLLKAMGVRTKIGRQTYFAAGSSVQWRHLSARDRLLLDKANRSILAGVLAMTIGGEAVLTLAHALFWFGSTWPGNDDLGSAARAGTTALFLSSLLAVVIGGIVYADGMMAKKGILARYGAPAIEPGVWSL